MSKVEIIKDGDDWYLIASEGVTHYSREYGYRLPLGMEDQILKALGLIDASDE